MWCTLTSSSMAADAKIAYAGTYKPNETQCRGVFNFSNSAHWILQKYLFNLLNAILFESLIATTSIKYQHDIYQVNIVFLILEKIFSSLYATCHTYALSVVIEWAYIQIAAIWFWFSFINNTCTFFIKFQTANARWSSCMTTGLLANDDMAS